MLASVTPEKLSEIKQIKSITKLGQGGFGAAYSIVSQDNKRSVIKVVNPDFNIAQYGYSPQEIMISCSYRHANLMRGIGVARASDFHPSFKDRGIAIVMSQY